MYLSTSTSTEDFPEMYLSTFQVLYKLYLSTDVLKYKVLLPGSGLRDGKNCEFMSKFTISSPLQASMENIMLCARIGRKLFLIG